MSRLASPRGIAALLFAAGAIVGSLIDMLPRRTLLQAGGYWILAGDFHVHAFPGDGALAPWTIREEARRAGLDVLAITNHNMLWPARLAQWAASGSDGPIVMAGQEITSADYHLIALGIERDVRPDQTAAQAIADVHAQGGVAIAAHPTRVFRWDDAAVRELDGTETAHPIGDDLNVGRQDFAAFFVRAHALKPGVSPIGSSDFHTAYKLAKCRTFVFVREPTAAGVLDAIRHGRTVAQDEGGLHGDPYFLQLLDGGRPAARTDANPVWRRVSVALVWIGMVGILAGSSTKLGRSRRLSRTAERIG